MTDVPRLTLRLITHPTPKAIPIVFGVFDGPNEIGWVTLPEFYRAQERLAKCGEPLPQYLKED